MLNNIQKKYFIDKTLKKPIKYIKTIFYNFKDIKCIYFQTIFKG